jgi:hypothetical protein
MKHLKTRRLESSSWPVINALMRTQMKCPCFKRLIQAGRRGKMAGLALIFAGGLILSLPAAEILTSPNPLSLEWLSVPDGAKTFMRSGFDYHDANYDSGNLIRIEPAGMSFSNKAAAWVLFEAEGPGVVTSVWFTGKNKKGEAYLGGRLNFFFDGQTHPAISGFLPDIFESTRVFSQAEKSSGGWICYTPVY